MSLAATASLALCLLGTQTPPAADAAVRYQQLVTEARVAFDRGQIASKRDQLEEAVKISDSDGNVWHWLGISRYQNKAYPEAIKAYQEAIRKGGFANKFEADCHYDIACCYALQGQIEPAFASLQRSMDLGFRSLDHIRTDEDLTILRNDPRWEVLTATKDVSKMTRDEGWRYDIWLMNRELRRIHYAPYRYHDAASHDAFIAQLNREVPNLTDNQIKVRMMQFVRRFGDGHTGIRPAHAAGLPAIPVQMSFFQEGLYITAAAPAHRELVGKKVIAVAGRPLSALLPILDTVIPQDNPMGLIAISPRYLSLPALLNGLGIIKSETEIELEFAAETGKPNRVTLLAVPGGPADDWVIARTGDLPRYLKDRNKAYWCEPVPELNALYVQYASVREEAEKMPAFAERVFRTMKEQGLKRLIIDIRFNGGGNTFTSRPFFLQLMAHPEVTARGNLFVITGRNTFSAAQNFATDLDRACDPIFVGEPTGSRPNFVGESVRFALPYSKMEGSISDLYWQRSWPMDDRMWIAPDLPAPPSFELFRVGRDPAMEAIAAYVKAN